VWPIYGLQAVGKNPSYSWNSQIGAISTTSVGQFVPEHPLPPQGFGKWCCQTFCIAVFVHRYNIKILKTYSDSSFLDSSNDTNFSSLGLFWAEQSLFKVEKSDPSGFCWFLAPKCSPQIVSVSSNNDCSAWNRPRELKSSGDEDSEYVFNIILDIYEWSGHAKRQISSWKVCVMNRYLLCGHFVDESEKCGYIWGTSHGESVNFRGSGDYS
jgi:hypothetical protein